MEKSIILVHGWRWEGNLLHPLKGNLFPFQPSNFNTLETLLKNKFNARVTQFKYDTGIFEDSGGNPSFLDIATALSNKLELEYEEGFQHFALIGHSAGGVVIRQCMTSDVFPELNDAVKLITLVASPYTGVVGLNIWKFMADILKALPSALATPSALPFLSSQGYDIAQGSNFLLKLNANWTIWWNKNQSVIVRCIYSSQDIIISQTDATVLDPYAVDIPNRTHTDIIDTTNGSLFFTTLCDFLGHAGFN